jgi:hypothetical protein
LFAMETGWIAALHGAGECDPPFQSEVYLRGATALVGALLCTRATVAPALGQDTSPRPDAAYLCVMIEGAATPPAGWDAAGLLVEIDADGVSLVDVQPAEACSLLIEASTDGVDVMRVYAANVDSTKASIIWTVSERATGQVDYGPTPAYGALSTPEESFDYSTHLQALKGLQPGTTYHFRVRSTTEDGILVTSEDHTFTTADMGDE